MTTLEKIGTRVRRVRLALILFALFMTIAFGGVIGFMVQDRDKYKEDVARNSARLDEEQRKRELLEQGLEKANERLDRHDLAPVPIPPGLDEGEIQEPEDQDPEVQERERQDPERQQGEEQDPEEQEEETQEPEIQDPEVDDPDPNSSLSYDVRTEGCAAADGEYISSVQPSWERSDGTLTLVLTCTVRPFPPIIPEAQP